MSVFVPGVGKVALKGLLPGFVVVAIGAVVAKPVLNASIRAGYGFVGMAKNAVASAKLEIEKAKAAANAPSGDAEVQKLREEVAQLRAQLAKRA